MLDLPEGFAYRIIDRAGDRMSDGYRVPARPDGMGSFVGPSGEVILLRNHENGPGEFYAGPYNDGDIPPPEAFTPDGMGGVSRLVLDGSTLELTSSNLVLIGTSRNCAGGISPWGWLSCEEDPRPGHGYVFLCPRDAERVAPARRIVPYGRFKHEAAAVQPTSAIAYLTEDQTDGSFYRFVPEQPDKPFEGTLQALRIKGEARFELGDGLRVGDQLDAEWVDLDEPDPADDSLRYTAQEHGAAVLRRGEGIWSFDDRIYICSTSGGPIDRGQIFCYREGSTGAQLELVAQSEHAGTLSNPDNITVAPWGDVFMCEDGRGDNYLRVLTPTGEVSDFARNAKSGSELAGACFSPDAGTLFVNMQHDGLTIAISGPFAPDTVA